MPRRRGPEAEAVANDVERTRWRYAIRNPAFIKELGALSDDYVIGAAYQSREWDAECDAFLLKWGFDYIELAAWFEVFKLTRSVSQFPPPTLEYFEAEQKLFAYPVVEVGEQQGPWLTLAVDMSLPLDVLIAAFEQEVKSAVAGLPRHRQRSDQTDFYLAVYDRAKKGETFSTIASALGRLVTTVKSAFVAAARHVASAAGAVAVPGSDDTASAWTEDKKRATPRRDALTAAFDPDRHWSTCGTCGKAETSDQMCAVAQAYMGFQGDRSDMLSAPESSRALKHAVRYHDAEYDE